MERKDIWAGEPGAPGSKGSVRVDLAARAKSRYRHVGKVRDALLARGYPRVDMFMLVIFTGCAGLLASFALFHAGIGSMALRYPLAVGIAFIVFLLQLRLWMWLRSRRTHRDAGLDLLPDLPLHSPDGASPVTFAGEGGSFDGGGASANFDVDVGVDDSLLGDSLGAVAEADEAAVPLMVVVALAAVCLSVFYLMFSLVSSAPLFFAELLVDGAMSASLYRRLSGIGGRHWAQTAVRRTLLPFAIAGVVLALAGFGMQHFRPDALTLGQFIAMAK